MRIDIRSDRKHGEAPKGEWSRKMDNPEAIRCLGRWLGRAGNLPTDSRPWMPGKSPGTGHQAPEDMEPAGAQPIVLALPSTNF